MTHVVLPFVGLARGALRVACLGLILSACNHSIVPVGLDYPLPARGRTGPCFAVGIDATLAGDRKDPRLVWLVPSPPDTRLVWPAGYKARFDPALEILDADGAVVLRQGSHISGVCLRGPAAEPELVMFIRPEP